MLGTRKCPNRNKSSIVGIYPGLNSTLYSSFYVANRNNIWGLQQFIAPQFLLKIYIYTTSILVVIQYTPLQLSAKLLIFPSIPLIFYLSQPSHLIHLCVCEMYSNFFSSKVSDIFLKKIQETSDIFEKIIQFLKTFFKSMRNIKQF